MSKTFSRSCIREKLQNNNAIYNILKKIIIVRRYHRIDAVGAIQEITLPKSKSGTEGHQGKGPSLQTKSHQRKPSTLVFQFTMLIPSYTFLDWWWGLNRPWSINFLVSIITTDAEYLEKDEARNKYSTNQAQVRTGLELNHWTTTIKRWRHYS